MKQYDEHDIIMVDKNKSGAFASLFYIPYSFLSSVSESNSPTVPTS